MTVAPSLVQQGLVGFATGPFVRALFSYLTGWVAAGAAAMVDALGRALAATTAPQLGAPFQLLSGRLLEVALVLALPLLLLATIHAVLRQEVGLLARAVVVGAPLATIGGAAALEVVRLAVAAGDELTGQVVATAGGQVGRLLHGIAGALVAGTGGAPGLPAFGLLLLAVVAAAVSFLLWVELVVRSAAIEVAALFLPLALAGALWPATAHWARRLGETIAALVLAKLVVAGVLALSAATLARPAGVAAVVQGIALLVLASCTPFALLRLVPAIESGTVSHLEGVGRRQLRAAGTALASLAARLPAGDSMPATPDPPGPAAPGGGAGPPGPLGGIGFLPVHLDPAAVAASQAEEAARLAGADPGGAA